MDNLLDLVLLAVVLLLALAVLLLMLLLSRISRWLLASIVRLLLLLVVLLLLVTTSMMRRWHLGRTAREIDIHASGVFLSRVLQTQLATDLLHARLDFLNVVDRVVPLANDPGL